MVLPLTMDNDIILLIGITQFRYCFEYQLGTYLGNVKKKKILFNNDRQVMYFVPLIWISLVYACCASCRFFHCSEVCVTHSHRTNFPVSLSFMAYQIFC